jgi:hypothetical protein
MWSSSSIPLGEICNKSVVKGWVVKSDDRGSSFYLKPADGFYGFPNKTKSGPDVEHKPSFYCHPFPERARKFVFATIANQATLDSTLCVRLGWMGRRSVRDKGRKTFPNWSHGSWATSVGCKQDLDAALGWRYLWCGRNWFCFTLRPQHELLGELCMR